MDIEELPLLDYLITSKAQISDDTLHLLNDDSYSLQLTYLPFPKSPNADLLGDISSSHFCPAVPQSLCKHVFDHMHL